jgi:hypothetical protein
MGKNPLPIWKDCHCNELFCAHVHTAQSACLWSHIAIDALLDSLDLDAVCDAAYAQQFFPDPYWERYQLADAVNGERFRKSQRSSGNIQEKWNHHESPYKGSLADDYHKASVLQNVTWGHYELLYNAVKERIRKTPMEKIPRPHTLVIHLRLGDVIDGSLDSVRELLFDQRYYYRNTTSIDTKNPDNRLPTPLQAPNNPPFAMDWNAYVRPLRYYSHVLLHNRKASLRSGYKQTVILMGSAHLGQVGGTNMTATKSCQYTKALQAYIGRIMPQAKISLRLGNPPDEDVVFAMQADEYVMGGGSFSRLINTLREHHARSKPRPVPDVASLIELILFA